MIRIALLSDVHGNLTAYRAVLADLERRGVDLIFNLGDLIGKGPRGAECIELTQQQCAVTVRGNWDAFIGDPDLELGDAAAWWRAQLSPEQRSWLFKLPFSHDVKISGRRLRVFHASAGSEFTRVHFHHTEDEFAAMFTNTERTGDGPEPIMVGYGDIHDTYLEVRDGRTLFNVGSVGNSLDEATAAYVIIEGTDGGSPGDPFSLQVVRLAYDVDAELAEAAKLGNPEQQLYEIELRRAIYRGTAIKRGLVDDPAVRS